MSKLDKVLIIISAVNYFMDVLPSGHRFKKVREDTICCRKFHISFKRGRKGEVKQEM